VLVGSGDLAMGFLQKTGGPIEAAYDPAREARA
jgi:hypothetical protein